MQEEFMEEEKKNEEENLEEEYNQKEEYNQIEEEQTEEQIKEKVFKNPFADSQKKGKELHEEDLKIFHALQKYKVGDIFESYKEMCQKLDLEVQTAGNAKKQQLENLQRFGRITRNGKKWQLEIYEIYKVVKPKKVKKDSIYVKYIERLLYDFFYQRHTDRITFTKSFLLYELGMVNNNYFYKAKKQKKQELIEQESDENSRIRTEENIEEFFSRVDKKLTSILHKALKSLVSRGAILLSYEMKVIDIEGNKRVMTTEDGKNIIKAKTETLQEMNETKIPYYRIEEYQQRLTNNLQKKGIVMAYKEYDIIINTEQEIYTWNVENMDRELKKELNKLKLKLNDNIIEGLKIQAKSTFKTNQQKVKEETEGIESGRYSVLAKKVIKQDQERIRYYLEERKVGENGFTTTTEIRPKTKDLGKDFLQLNDKFMELFIKLDYIDADINEELTENNKKRNSQIETYTEDDIEAATYGLLGDIIKEEK